MTSERVQRQIDRLLDEAETALAAGDWASVRLRAEAVLRLDPSNADAATYLQAANRDSAAPAAETTAHAAAQPTHPAQPDSFADGRYAVKRFLGEGGKKKVYLAHDARLDRDVAFALIKTEGLDAAARERITREAQAMGRLGNHPNIVTVYDIGEEGGQPFLVLPVLEGGDVEGLIEKAPEHRLPLDEVIQIAVDTCQGLELAHGRGIIHRDLKPGNVWLTREGRAMIGDFGLAVAVDRSRLTQAGMMVGTVSYMPPEQAMGGEITPRSDLYALGAMLYEMVCGRPPFVGDESVAIIGQHLNTPPVAPTWHRPDCPPALETLILRLLEKDPEKRPGSAAEVRDALRAVRVTDARTATQSAIRPEPAGADPLYRTVFVGREAELRQLQQAFDAAMSGQGGLVMVVGEPGIGKTALCEQLATYVSIRGGRTLVGHCYEEGSLSLPYLAFVEAMRTYVMARDPDGLKSDLGSGAADVARIVSEVRDRVQVELREASDPEDDRWRLLQSVTTFLRNAAAVQPLVIVLEDLHWADRGTLDLLQHVARNLQGARLVVVGTYRDVEVDRAHPLSAAVAELRRSGSFLRVPLRGLTVDEVHRMYEALRGNDVPWGQAENVHRQTEGNPLFVQEVLRYLVEEGIVVREGGRYVAQTPGEGVPEGLRDVIGRRLSHLDEKTNTVLSIAAVIGRDFRLDVLQKVAGLSEEDLYAALEEATDRAIVEQVQSPSGVAFRFTHAMFRTLLYEEIFAPRRIRWHQQVGRALEEIHSRRLEEHAAELAEHFTQSTEAADLEKAVRYSELAAQRAVNVFAYGEGVRHLEQALRAQEVLDPDDRAKRCDLLLGLGTTLNDAGEPQRVLDEVAPAALDAAQSLGDNKLASHACQRAIDAIFALGAGAGPSWNTPEAERWCELADQLAEDNTKERFWADSARIWFYFGRQQFDEALERLSSVQKLAAALQDHDLQWLADAYALVGFLDSEGRRRLATEMLRRSTAGVRQLTLRQAYYFMSVFAFLPAGDRQGFDEAVRRCEAIAEKTRQPNVVLLAQTLRGISLLLDGRLEESRRAAADLVAHGEELGLVSYVTTLTHTFEPRACFLMGLDLREALRYEPLLVSAARNPLALLRSLGDADATIRSINEFLARIPPARLRLATPIALMTDVALRLGEVDLVRRLRSAMPDVSQERFIGGPIWIVSTGRLLGDAAAVTDEPVEARSRYESALESCESFGMRAELALTHLGLAELLLEHYPDERDAAIEHLDFAISELRDMKMQPALERALGRRGLLKA